MQNFFLFNLHHNEAIKMTGPTSSISLSRSTSSSSSASSFAPAAGALPPPRPVDWSSPSDPSNTPTGKDRKVRAIKNARDFGRLEKSFERWLVSCFVVAAVFSHAMTWACFYWTGENSDWKGRFLPILECGASFAGGWFAINKLYEAKDALVTWSDSSTHSD